MAQQIQRVTEENGDHLQIASVTEKTTTKWTVFIDCHVPNAGDDHVLAHAPLESWTYV